jgi:acetate---CoA ligase (ADP-forming) subunit beta
MSTLSEVESKGRLAALGVPMLDERTVDTPRQAAAAAASMGFPVVVKLCGDAIAHKTERGLVRLNLANADSVEAASDELLAKATPDDGPVLLLVAPMVRGTREFIAGATRDEQFGPCVMLGVGGVLAEALADVQIRLAPIERVDAEEMIEQLATQKLLGEFRGEPAVDRSALCDVLIGLSELITTDDQVVSVDVNPLIVSPSDGRPIAVDALVEVTS